MNVILERLVRWRTLVKRAAMADMHRIACGTVGCSLPPAVPDETAHRPQPPLEFSLRRRQLLSWSIFASGGSH